MIRSGESYVIGANVASKQGLLRCGLSRLEVHRVTEAGLVHDSEVASVAVELHSALRGRRVISERELSIEGGDEGALDRLATMGQRSEGEHALHRPDLLVVSPAGRVAAVEVETPINESLRLEQLCRYWARARRIDAVYYLAESASARAVERVVSGACADERITVLPLGSVRKLVAMEMKEDLCERPTA
jgi:hypothetical protein